MGKTIIILVSSLLLLNSCKHEPAKLSEEEVYTILNEIIADDSLPIYCVGNWFEQLPYDDTYAKYFTKQDSEFIAYQKLFFYYSEIKPGKLKYFSNVDKAFHFVKVGSVDRKKFFEYDLSFPLISADKQKVLIVIGRRYNDGCKYLFEKKNGHWVRTKEFECWVE